MDDEMNGEMDIGFQNCNSELWKDLTSASFSSTTSVSLPEVAEVTLISPDFNQTELSLPSCDLNNSSYN